LYCCRQHQKDDWKKHKLVCKVLSCASLATAMATDAEEGERVPHDAATWKDFLVKKMTIMRLAACATGEQDPFAPQFCQDTAPIWYMQAKCLCCFACPFITPSVSLTYCSICNQVAHCASPACAETFASAHNIESCEKKSLQLAALVMSNQQGNKIALISNSRRSSFLPSWTAYFRHDIRDFDVHYQLVQMPPVMAMLTESLSLAKTIVRGLHLTYDKDELASLGKIVIHVLGATLNEVSSSAARFEEILHDMPQCTELVVSLIGPGVFVEKQRKETFPCKLCAACRAAGCNATLHLASGCYHDLQHEAFADVSQATLLIAMHSGIHDEDGGFAGLREVIGSTDQQVSLTSMWRPTVELVARADKPAIFTSFNREEAVGDEHTLLRMGAKVHSSHHLNPFRGLFPHDEVFEDEQYYYTNNYMCIIKGLQE